MRMLTNTSKRIVSTAVYISDTVVGVGVCIEKYPCGKLNNIPRIIDRHVIWFAFCCFIDLVAMIFGNFYSLLDRGSFPNIRNLADVVKVFVVKFQPVNTRKSGTNWQLKPGGTSTSRDVGIKLKYKHVDLFCVKWTLAEMRSNLAWCSVELWLDYLNYNLWLFKECLACNLVLDKKHHVWSM